MRKISESIYNKLIIVVTFEKGSDEEWDLHFVGSYIFMYYLEMKDS